MADLVAQFGLDDSDFARGLQRSERAAISSSERIFRKTSQISAQETAAQERHAHRVGSSWKASWAMGAAAATAAVKAYELALRSAIRYGEESGRGRRQVSELRREFEGLKQDFGRASFDSGIVQASTFLLKNLRAARTEAELLVSDMMSGEPGSAREKLGLERRIEAMTREAAVGATYGDEDLALRVREATARGDERGAAEARIQQRMRAENKRLASLDIDPARREELRGRSRAAITAEEMAKVNAGRDAGISAANAAEAKRYAAGVDAFDRVRELETAGRARELRGRGMFDVAAGVEAQAGISARLEALRRSGADEATLGRVNAAEQAGAAASIAEQRREREERREERLEGYRLAEKRLEVDKLSRAGKEREAQVLAATLATEERITKIREDELLTAAERAHYIEAERRALGGEVEAIQSARRGTTTRTISAGVGDSLIRRQVLGGGKAETMLAEQVNLQRRQVALLERIADKPGAVFALLLFATVASMLFGPAGGMVGVGVGCV